VKKKSGREGSGVTAVYFFKFSLELPIYSSCSLHFTKSKLA